MFQFFDGIVKFIGIVVDFVVSVFNMLLIVVTQIPASIAFIASGVVYLPDFVKVFALLFVGTCVAFNLINKGE